MRIGIFYRDLLSPGGIPRETFLLAQSLAKHVEEVLLFAYQGSGELLTADRNAECKIVTYHVRAHGHCKGILGSPALLQRLKRNDDRLDALLVIGSYIPANLRVVISACQGGIPLVLSPGDAFHPALYCGWRGAVRSLYERLFEVPVVHAAVALRLYSIRQTRHLLARGLDPAGKAFVLKEGIDWATIESECRGSPSRFRMVEDRERVKFGFLGRLDIYQKGLDLLFEGWQSYREHGGKGELLVAGPGRGGVRSELLARAGRAAHSVRFLGPLRGEEKYRFIAGLNMLVVPSRHEGIPRVVREAFACSVPVMVTPETNLHDVVQEFGAGIVTEASAPNIAAALSQAEALGTWAEWNAGAASAAKCLDWREIGRTLINEITRRLAA